MAYDSRAIANYIIKKARSVGKELTPMQIIKLVYFAHGWTLALTGNPLSEDAIEAWDYGPVIRPVYDAFKRFGNAPVTMLAVNKFSAAASDWEDAAFDADFLPDERKIMDKVWDIYGHLRGLELSALTHAEDTPWSAVYHENGQNSTIPDRLIREYFRSLAKKNAEKRQKAQDSSD